MYGVKHMEEEYDTWWECEAILDGCLEEDTEECWEHYDEICGEYVEDEVWEEE